MEQISDHNSDLTGEEGRMIAKELCQAACCSNKALTELMQAKFVNVINHISELALQSLFADSFLS